MVARGYCRAVRLVVAAAVVLAVFAITGADEASAAEPRQGLPPFTPLVPFDPTDLGAMPGVNPGEVHLNWNASPNATAHWVWSVKSDNTGGKWTAGQAGTATVSGLEIGQLYWFIVIAAQQRTGEPVSWSEFSNWTQSFSQAELPAALTPSSTTESDGFVSVSASTQHTCGIRANGSVLCWGDNGSGRATPPDGSFQSVSAGRDYTCGIGVDGAVACWGFDNSGQATPPAGDFRSISASKDYYAYAYTCGVRTDGSVACWGNGAWGKTNPPEGSFQSVSAGGYHACGVLTDSGVVCWGSDGQATASDTGDGRATPPSGSFQAVSAGSFHTCGLRTDSSVVCWGGIYGSETEILAGIPFRSISSGVRHSCGVRAGLVAGLLGF